MLPLALFRSRNLSGATAVGLIFNLVLYGSLLCLSLYLQQGRHEPALATGLLLLPMSLVVGAGSLASGPLTARFGPRPPMIAGLAIAAAGAALLATAGPGTSLTVILGGSVLLGLVALAMPAMTAAVVGAAGTEHAGVASGILNAARQSGGALGVALLGSLLGSRAGPGPARPAAWSPPSATWSRWLWPGSSSADGRRRLTARTIREVRTERMGPHAAAQADD